MSNGQILLLILELTALFLYIIFAAIYHSDAKGYSKISFRTFLSLYKAAPGKWEPYWEYGYGYLYYKTDTCSREIVHMKTYFDRILFYIWGYTREWREEKLEETENTLKLIEYWKKDLRGEDNEQ